MYVGSTSPRLDPNQYVPTFDTTTMTTTMNPSPTDLITHPALVKIFDEILVNASDNLQRSSLTSTVSVTILPGEVDPDTGSLLSPPLISVVNDGGTVPVVVHQGENMYLQQMLFGHLLTGSNFKDGDGATTGGRHGYGAKLTNIFSKWFEVECNDAESGRNYRARWEDNMRTRGEEHITSIDEAHSTTTPPTTETSHPQFYTHIDTKKSFTRITFQPDLDALQIQSEVIPQDDYQAMCRRVVDIAGSSGFKSVYLNGHPIDIKNFKHYSRTFSPPPSPPPLHSKINSRWEVCVSPCSSGGGQHSFINNLTTPRGGSHVTAITGQIVKGVQDNFKRKYPRLPVPNPALIKNNVRVFINGKVEDPSFDSQSKEYLTTHVKDYGTSVVLPSKYVKQICSSSIFEDIKRLVEAGQTTKFRKLMEPSKRKSGISVPKLDDANWAGTEKGKGCTLILTEGDSAKALAVSGLEIVGRDEYGVFPLRGKILNVRDVSTNVLSKNSEVKNLCAILGLDFGKKYDTDEERTTLRYGKVMIMTDQDPDGSHIKGLVVNFVRYFWPALLQAKPNFVGMFTTPLVKAFRGKEELSFGSMAEYKEWNDENERRGDGKKYRIKYYKGLGTSTSKEGKEYFSNIDEHFKEFEWSDGDGTRLDMAFDKKKSEERRNWILDTYSPTAIPAFGPKVSFQQFVDEELIHFSNADNVRSIPNAIDGLKPSQRKVLFACFKKNLKNEIKVAQLAGYIAEQTSYHHGEQSLHATIIGMAQDFVGSNNLNLLFPSGQFGTRLTGGKDSASPRYIFTKLEKAARVVYNELDDGLLERQEDDGQVIEPFYYVPIVPMLLINGCQGIGTGWSTFIPPYNPQDIVDRLRYKLGSTDKEPGRLVPWIKNFKGTYKMKTEDGVLKGVTTRGVVKKKGATAVVISELPYNKWTGDYKETLVKMRDANLIKGFTEMNTTHSVDFQVQMTGAMLKANEKRLHEFFKLDTNLNTTNMNAFDMNGTIKKYENAEEILSDFFDVRLDMYYKRKVNLEKKSEYQTKVAMNKARFIEAVTSGEVELVTGTKTREEIVEQLAGLGFESTETLEKILGEVDDADADANAKSYDYLLNTPLSTFTKEKIAHLVTEADERKVTLEQLRATSPEEMWLRDLDDFEALLPAAKSGRKKRNETKHDEA
ncbi:hypothetical protein TrVE_jg13240 [Triparma verrucosa]|uniref:DNA topoisomerase 2 n=1 Tax=Triparma verrucosa TaxID=1606542 RepID=A0A9W7BJG4_9STRA|nr:hypothetical protein TrVE_jg13240 [Triparma verrucosa]